MFRRPQKSESTSCARGTDDSVLQTFEIFSLFMFSRKGIPLLTFLLSNLNKLTSKI